MSQEVEVRLSEGVEEFCRLYQRRIDSSGERPGVKRIFSKAALVAASTLLGRTADTEVAKALKEFRCGATVGSKYQLTKECIEQFATLYERVWSQPAPFSDRATRSSFVCTCVQYCAQTEPTFGDDIRFVLAGSAPNQLHIPLDANVYGRLQNESTLAESSPSKLLERKVVALIRKIRAMTDQQVEVFIQDLLRIARTFNPTRTLPTYVRIASNEIDVSDIERLRPLELGLERPKFVNLKYAVAVKAMEEQS